MYEIVTTEGSINVLAGGKVARTIPKGQQTATEQAEVVQLAALGTAISFNLPVSTTLDGVASATLGELASKLSSFKKGGGSGTGAVESVTGDLVGGSSDNPTVNLFEWVYWLRSDRVGGINISEGGTYVLGSEYIDATMLLGSTPINNYTLRFPRLMDVPFKRHVVVFNVDVKNITLQAIDNVKIKGVLNEAKANDIWVLTYDRFSASWHLEGCNSVPKWYIDNLVPTLNAGEFLVGSATGNVSRKPLPSDVGMTSDYMMARRGQGNTWEQFPMTGNATTNNSVAMRNNVGSIKMNRGVNLDEGVNVDQFQGITNNALTTAETSTTLNALYPNIAINSVVRSIANNIKYIKISATQWEKLTLTVA